MNMSYCRFRNTLGDLRDCRYFIDADLSPEEHAARRWLIKVCRDIVRDADDNPEIEEIEDADRAVPGTMGMENIMGAWISRWSGMNSRGANFKHGWRAYATEAEAEADQDSLRVDWRDGVEYRAGDVEPGDEWEGA